MRQKPLKLIMAVLALCVLIACSRKPNNSPLAGVKISVGMRRTELERLVTEATGAESRYNAHSMYDEAEVRYEDDYVILLVKFRPGAPAPYVKTEKGIQHLPPAGSTVLSWKFVSK